MNGTRQRSRTRVLLCWSIALAVASYLLWWLPAGPLLYPTGQQAVSVSSAAVGEVLLGLAGFLASITCGVMAVVSYSTRRG